MYLQYTPSSKRNLYSKIIEKSEAVYFFMFLTKLELQKKDIVPTLETISLKRLRTLLQIEYELLSNDCAVASSAG